MQTFEHLRMAGSFFLSKQNAAEVFYALERATTVKRTSWGSRAMNFLQTSAASCKQSDNLHKSSK